MARVKGPFASLVIFTTALLPGCSDEGNLGPEDPTRSVDSGIDPSGDASGDGALDRDGPDPFDRDSDVVEHCSDGIMNGQEVGVDCGGDVCPPCLDGGACFDAGDCESGACRDGTCERAPSRLDVSADHRYLVDQEGRPVYLLGGTAWTMPENATREDVGFYLDDRVSKGFNYVQVVAVRDLDTEPLDSSIERTMNPANMYGHRPFEATADDRADPSRPITSEGGTPADPNDYWDHLEYVIQAARERNMYIGILPTWGLYYVNTNDPDQRLFTETSSRSYGRFLGERFREYPHIIWILGGDAPADRAMDARPIYRAMAEGLVEGATGENPRYDEDHAAWSEVMITYHGGDASAQYFDDDSWLRLNMVYENDPELLPNIETYYDSVPTRPMLEGECWYEGWVWDGSYKDARVIRRQMHHVFLGGALGGFVYGVAKSSTTSNDQVFRFQPGWRDRLDLEGANDVIHLKTVLDDHEWWRWVPDQTLIRSGLGSGESLKAAARSAAGTEIIVYFANVDPASIDMSAVTSHLRVRATWHDPRDGNRHPAGVFEASQTQTFRPPSDWEDALLLLEGTDDPLEDPSIEVTEFRTIDGEVVLAAEGFSYTGGSGGDLGTWSLETTEDGHLGEGYMRSSGDRPADGSHLLFRPESASLAYVIDFDATGTYYVHLRTLAYDHTENGFFATLDGEEIDYGGANPDDPSKTAYYVYVRSSGGWSWYTDGGGAETRGLRVSFDVDTPGRHTFALHRRDTGSRVDHIWLTMDDVAPLSTATLDLPDPSLFLVDGD